MNKVGCLTMLAVRDEGAGEGKTHRHESQTNPQAAECEDVHRTSVAGHCYSQVNGE